MKTDFGFKEVDINEKKKLVGDVFTSVADKYDVMNDLMSLGLHRLWKRHAVSLLQVHQDHHVLDLAAGTGDLSRLIAPKVTALGKITLCDINFEMLSQGKNRLLDSGLFQNIQIIQGNAEYLPFPSNTFDRIIMGFGLRNVTHKELALKEISRVLKPGGRFVILEFSHPTCPLPGFSQLYDAYSFHVLPQLGKWIANDSESYRYLAESIRMHPNQEKLKEMICACGFDTCHYQNLSGGIVALHQGIKY